MLGTNFNDIDVVRANTVHGYGDAVNILFQKRGFPLPAQWTEAGNVPSILVDNLKKEQDVASQRSPLDCRIFAQLYAKADASKSPDSIDNVFFNLLALARYVGPRSSEYAQTKQSECDYHTYPSGKTVVKAFNAVPIDEGTSKFGTNNVAHSKESPERPAYHAWNRYQGTVTMPGSQLHCARREISAAGPIA
jgi:hypothetical protein